MSYLGEYVTCNGCTEDFIEEDITWLDDRAWCAKCVPADEVPTPEGFIEGVKYALEYLNELFPVDDTSIWKDYMGDTIVCRNCGEISNDYRDEWCKDCDKQNGYAN